MIELRNSRVLRTIPLMLIAVLFCPLTYGKVIYVDDDATGTNDGTNWADAYNYLQDALADASTAEKPVEIHVAQGLYKPDRGAGFTLGDRRASFHLTNGVILRGGFAGVGLADPDAKNFEIYETILSGDLAGDDIDVISPSDLSDEATRSDNSRTIVSIDDSEATIELDGLNVAADGTGIRMSKTIIIIHGSEVTVELDGLTVAAGGTGIQRSARGGLTISNCTFKGNSDDSIGNSRGVLTIASCTFQSNRGNAVSHWGDNLTVTDCLFEGNWGTRGVGVDCSGSSIGEVTLRDCTFADNVATGIFGVVVDCDAKRLGLYNCKFTGNVTDRTACVGAWGTEDLVAENCTFTGNFGGAIDHWFGRLIVSNCVLAGNRGPAIKSLARDVTIRNCTFSDNCTDSYGSALFIRDESKVSNCIFWANTAIRTWPPGELMMDYCNVEGGWPGVGNINVDPGFVAPGHWELNGTPDDVNDDFWVGGDYHLLSQAGRWDPDSESWVLDDATSPCIDAGDPNGPIGTEPFPNGGRINVGAYGAGDTASKTYFGGPACDVILAGDINGDCVVDFDDLMIMISHWMMRGEDFVNKPPVVTLIEPQDGDIIAWPGPTTFLAEASDADSEVDEVRFWLQQKRDDGSHTIGFGGNERINGWEDEFTWEEDLPSGTWTVWAEATDNEGGVGVSPKIAITLYRP